MNWLGLIAGLLLVPLLFMWIVSWTLLAVLLVSSSARRNWMGWLVTIDRTTTRALASQRFAASESTDPLPHGPRVDAPPSIVRADLVLPNRFVIPVTFVAVRRHPIVEIRSKVSWVLVATWVIPVIAAPLLPVFGVNFKGGLLPVVLSTIGFAIAGPASSWVAFRGLRARTRDLRKSTLGV